MTMLDAPLAPPSVRATGPRAVPPLRAEFVKEERWGLGEVARKFPGRYSDGLLGRLVDGIGTGSMYFMSDGMVERSMLASSAIPSGAVLGSVLPSSSGFMALGSRLPFEHPCHCGACGSLSPEIVGWAICDFYLVFGAWSDGGACVCEPYWVAARTTGIVMSDGPISDSRERNHPLLRFLVAAFTLMQQEAEAEVTEKRVPGKKTLSGRGKPVGVKVVELRKIKRRPVEPDATPVEVIDEPAAPEVAEERPERVHDHQWTVRGHWRNQPCGPGRKEIRKVWVPAHVKGPEGAPLVDRETVFALRR